MTWKHRDSELDRTCGKPLPMTREDRFRNVSEPFCGKCDGEAYAAQDHRPEGCAYCAAGEAMRHNYEPITPGGEDR